MFIITECPVCRSNSFEKNIECKDYTVSKELFTIVSCTNCNFKFTNPRPSNEVLGDYYKSEDYISHTDTTKGIISKLYHKVRSYTLNKKINFISEHVSRGTILDYGCGTGMFLNKCKLNGWETFGIEPDLGARKIASEMDLKVFPDKESLERTLNINNKFDIITLWHVLEHVTDLNQTITFLKQSLKPNGTLIIAVPNYKSYDAKIYNKFWAAYDVPRHLYHFDQVSIQTLLNRFSFKLNNIKPMKFDSFYVSMLSEKYKTGSINYLKAFRNGLFSNIKASSSKEYSSLIYIFKQE